MSTIQNKSMTRFSLLDDHYWNEIEHIFSRIDKTFPTHPLNSYQSLDHHSNQPRVIDRSKIKGKVLVTAERWQLAFLLEKCLWRQGLGTVTATNSNEIMQMVTSEGIDLIILDLDLLGEAALTVLQEIHCCQAQLPILILTRFDELGDRAIKLINHLGDVLPLPFTTQELIERVKLWMWQSS